MKFFFFAPEAELEGCLPSWFLYWRSHDKKQLEDHQLVMSTCDERISMMLYAKFMAHRNRLGFIVRKYIFMEFRNL